MTKLNHSKHIHLIQSELLYQTNEFNKLLKKKAARMFIDNELYLCRYQGFDESRGNIIVKFDHRICNPPRKNEILLCFVSKTQDDSVKNWGGLTYENLRSTVTNQFESKTVFFTYNANETIVGLSGIKSEDVTKYQKNDLMFLAPNDPPLNYLHNLYNFLKDTNPSDDEILNISINAQQWNPLPLTVDSNIVHKIQMDFMETDTIIIQGPPGTGKTFLMSLLCEAFVNAGYKVLITALTNRALIELAEKEHLQLPLKKGLIYKSSLSADEQKNKKIKGLKQFKSLTQQQPEMLLCSYYVMSQIASKVIEGNHFDYVIIEEASQSFLSTLAIAKRLGKKCIIIGDIKQLSPIFAKEFPPEDEDNYHLMVCGLKAVSYYLEGCKNYILTTSYRLNSNSVLATNAFYEGQLQSKFNETIPPNLINYPILKNSLNTNGGPSLKKMHLSEGIIPTKECIDYIIKVIDSLLDIDKTVEIAVLAFNRNSVRYLQKEIYSKCSKTANILIETIDRVQGLTTDFCLFFIPLDAFAFALQPNRFNVATSRARICTLIIADYAIHDFVATKREVNQYLENTKIAR